MLKKIKVKNFKPFGDADAVRLASGAKYALTEIDQLIQACKS